MSEPDFLGEILRLSVEERLRLVDAVWESIASHPGSLPLNDAQRAELDRRLTEHCENPEAARPWSDVRDSSSLRK
ncbi:MAG: addiction module protein [Acidobacteria bacterium]|nr:addiction module protein [Acidobacteriota bacterium]